MMRLPLFEQTADLDAWHHVTSPGGYEWWYFDAEDTTGDLQLVAIFLEGFVFHPGYLRRYAAYKRRPTKHRPPVAGDFPCVYFVLYERGKIRAQFMVQYPPAAFSASKERVDVKIGPNHFRREADGSLRLSLIATPWKLTWRGPMSLDGQVLSAELTFRPRYSSAPMQRTFLSRPLSGAEHRWVIADPACDVSGSVVLREAAGERPAQTVTFAGRGYHDHNYGTAPIGPGLKKWVWGRAIADDRIYTFHFARAKDRRMADEVHLVRADASGQSEVTAATCALDWKRHTAMALAYPAEIDFSPHLKLTTPRVVDSAPFYMRVIYDAVLDGSVACKAFCEVAYPHRLRWPILGRMIERSIHQPPIADR